MPKLEDELTSSNVLEYAQAAIDTGIYMSTLTSEGYTNILIPSRGAYPFYELGKN